MCVCVCVWVCVGGWVLFQVRDGSSEYAAQLSSAFCETSLPLTVKSSGNSMWIKFHSDGVSNNASTGFGGYYTGQRIGRFQHNLFLIRYCLWCPHLFDSSFPVNKLSKGTISMMNE